MKLQQLVEIVLEEQSNRFRPIPVDITISNGNILLRSFHIKEFDSTSKTLIGLTQQEEYAYIREGRDPVYCYLKINDIKEIVCLDLGIEAYRGVEMARV
jgi:hypothetical protein